MGGWDPQMQALVAATAAAAAGLVWWRLHQQSRGGGSGGGPAGGSASSGGSQAAVLEAVASCETSGQTGKSVDETAQAEQHAQAEAAAAAAEQQVAAAAAVAGAARQVLFRATQNEVIVHEMLLSGQEGDFLPPLDASASSTSSAVPARLAAGRRPTPAAAAAGDSAALPADSLAALAAAPTEEQELQQELQHAVVGTVERAFFDYLADQLRRGNTGALASLLLDARDQLAALLPQSAAAAASQQQQQQRQGGVGGGGGSSEGQALLAELMENLDSDYVSQRLQRYDAQYCAQAFDFLVGTITRLQAPARRDSTREQHAAVAALFAAAARAEEAGAGDQPSSKAVAGAQAEPAQAEPAQSPAAAQAVSPGPPTLPAEELIRLELEPSGNEVAARLFSVEEEEAQAGLQGDAAGQESEAQAREAANRDSAAGDERVRLLLQGSGDLVSARLVQGGAGGAAEAAEAAAAPAASTAAKAQPAQLQWELRLVPSRSGDGSTVAVMMPVASPPASPSVAAEGTPGSSSSTSGTIACGEALHAGAVNEASIAAVVAAAQFMHRQLSELKADMAAAHLALLKEAILGNGSGIQYERQRYARALQAAATAAAAAHTQSGGSGGGAASSTPAAVAADPALDPAAAAAVAVPPPELVAEAFPLTHAWLRQVLLETPPPPPANPQQADPAYTRACVSAGLLLLLQRPQAITAFDCPETLLLDLKAIVALQNELQRLCLLAASLLIVQQILAHKRALPLSGSPAHQQLCQRVLRRMGALLSSGPPMESLVLEIHRQVDTALADRQQQVPADRASQDGSAGHAAVAAAAAAAPAVGSRGGSTGAAEGGATTTGPAAGQTVAEAEAPPSGTGQQQQGQQAAAGVELDMVRRMVQQIFSVDHTAFRRVQAGIVAAATALFRNAAGAPATGGSTAGSEGSGAASSAGSSWRLTLRALQAELLAPEVHRLASALGRVAAVSTAVAQPLVYGPLLSQLLGEQPLAQQLHRRRH